MLEKDDAEHPLPERWWPAFRRIADAFVAGDYELRRHPVEGVVPVSPATAEHIAATVSAYGDVLAPLDDAVWQRSVYRWMDGYWHVLVELTTEREPVSDLTLHARLKDGSGSRFQSRALGSAFHPKWTLEHTLHGRMLSGRCADSIDLAGD